MITYHVDGVKAPVLLKRKIAKWLTSVAQLYGYKVGDLNYIFCSDEKILEVNNQYLQHDYYTDIITFDYTEKNKINGDVFVSVDTVASNAIQFDVTFEQELLRVIIHGVLHLCGQADKTPRQQAEMTRKENEALVLWNQI